MSARSDTSGTSGRLRVVARALAAIAVPVLLVAAVASSTPPASAQPPGGFVTRDGTQLVLDGHPWRLFGASTYGTSNPYASHSIGDEIALATAAGLNTLRVVDMIDTGGAAADAPYEESSWVRVDQLLAEMRDAELKAILDLSAFRNHLEHRELYLKGIAAVAGGYPVSAECSTKSGVERDRCVGEEWCIENAASCTTPYDDAVVGAWETFLEFVASRVNTVTGVEYRADPTIAIVSFAGEPEAPNSGEALKPTTQGLTDFYSRVFDEWKSHDPNHLVTTGGLLHIDWPGSGSGIDHEAIFALPNQDVLSIHDYFGTFPATAANDTKIKVVAPIAEQLGKPWINEEFGFLQEPVKDGTTYTEADRGAWFRNVFELSRNPPVGVPAAGVAFWNLGPEVRSDSHDVNPGTPATWAAVLAEGGPPPAALEISGVTEVADSVARYARFEASIELGETFANPFDPEQIAVDVTFTSPTGVSRVVPAFWYEPFTASGSTYETYTPAGSPGWHVRFAPTEVGTYTYSVGAVAGSRTAAPVEGSFQATASSLKGFVRTDSRNNRYLRFDDGTPYVPIGHNIAFEDGNPALNGVGYYDDLLTSFGRAGENWARIWMTDFNRSALEWGEGHYSGLYHGPGVYSLPSAWRLDRILELAEQNGVHMQVVLSDFGQFSNRGEDRWATRCAAADVPPCEPGDAGYDPGNAYNAVNGGPVPAARPDLFFANAEARDLMKKRLRYIVARWGAFSSVLAWELFNEVQFVGTESENPSTSPQLRDDIVDWHAEMAQYLKSTDPFGHLVTTSAAVRDAGAPVSGLNAVWALPAIDVVQIHWYEQQPELMTAGLSDMIADFGDLYDKPVIVGELGLPKPGLDANPEPGFDPTTFAGDAADRDHLSEGTHLHNAMWAAAVSGSGAGYWWWGNYVAADTDRHRGPPTFPLNEHVAPALVSYLDGEDWAPLGLERAEPEASGPIVAVGSASSTRAYLWIRDAENEYGTGARPGHIVGRAVTGAEVTVPGIADGTYRVRVYDTWGDAGVTDSFTAIASDGSLALTLPSFERDIAVKVDLVAPEATVRVDLEADGDEPAGGWSPGSTEPSLSDDGRWVVFTSTKAMTPEDASNGQNRVYVKDMSTGAVVRVAGAVQVSEGSTFGGVISADGRFVAFWTSAGSVYVHDRDTDADGVFDEADEVSDELATLDSNEVSLGCSLGGSPYVTLSANGRYVLFVCGDSLFPGDTNGGGDVFLRDRQAGTTEIVTLSVDDQLVPGGGASVYGGATISNDGRYVAFLSESDAIDPTADPDRAGDVFIRDRVAGTTELASVSSTGEKSNDYGFQTPGISRDGSKVLFASTGTNLVSGDGNGTQDVFVRDLVARTTERVSVAGDEGEADGMSGGFFSNYGPMLAGSLSPDGRYVAFASFASNLDSGDTNGRQDIFVRDRVAGTTRRVSVPPGGGEFPADVDSDKPAITPDGRFVVFDVGQLDVYRRDLLGAVIGEPADLSITKVGSADPVLAGSQLTYTLTVDSAGPAAAADVVVTDTLPAGVSFVSASDGGTESSGVITWNLGTIAASDPPKQLTLVVDVTAGQADDLVNTAHVSTSSTDSNAANNSATESTTVEPPADLSWVVNKTADTDDGLCTVTDCTLREAINRANSEAGHDTIGFDFDDADDTTPPYTIHLTSNLPDVTQPVTVDATTEPDFAGTPVVELDGSTLRDSRGRNPGGSGLTIRTNGGTTVRGLAIGGFEQALVCVGVGYPYCSGGYGIYLPGGLPGGPAGNIIQGNHVGTDGTGTEARPNKGGGIYVNTPGTRIGGNGQGQGNIVSANGEALELGGGITLSYGSNGSVVEGNLVGTGPSGSEVLGNVGPGILLDNNTRENRIGGTAGGAGNTIVNNTVGILILGRPSDDPNGQLLANTISRNAISGNVGLGIDLLAVDVYGPFSGEGVTPNDAGDSDVGANNLQNHPVLTEAETGLGTTVAGSLNSAADTSYQIEFFESSSCDISGNGEGETYLGSTTVITNGDGAADFSTTLIPTAAPGHVVTATATDPAGNTSEFSACRAVTTAIIRTDLSITKADSVDPVQAGSQLTYTLTVDNAGPADAADVVVTDTLPAGVTFVSASDGGTEAGGVVTWNLGTVEPADPPKQLTLVVEVVAGQTADLVNGAEVSSSIADSNAANNAASETTAIENRPPQVSLTADPASGVSPLDVQLDATGSDPDGQIVGWVLDFGDGTAPVINNDTNEGISESFQHTYAIPGTYTAAFTATDDDGAQTTVEVTIEVTEPPTADLSIIKSDSVDPVRAGSQLTYTLTVDNAGPADAADVVVTDTLPAGVTFVSASDGGTEAGGLVTWNLGTVEPADPPKQLTLVVEVVAGQTADLVNEATVSTSTTDSNAANDAADEPTAIQPPHADLEVSLVSRPVSGIVGDEFSFEPTVTNHGADGAQAVTLTIALPAGVALLDGGSCTGTTTLTCSLGEIAADASTTVSIRVRPTSSGVLTTAASVSAATADPVIANNGATLHTVVSGPSPLWAWGGNCYGVIGDGTLPVRPTFEVVTGLPAIESISASESPGVFALTPDGHVWSWGTGFVGDGTPQNFKRVAPVRIPGLADVVDLSIGREHRLAATEDGTVYAWGGNSGRQLGLPRVPAERTALLAQGLDLPVTTSALAPVEVRGLPSLPLPAIDAVAAGYDFSLALDRDGRVWAWGGNSLGQLGVPGGAGSRRITPDLVTIPGDPRIIAIAAANRSAFALDDAGRLWAWGGNGGGVLGDGVLGVPTSSRPTPTPVLAAPGVELTGVTAVESSTYASFAIAGSARQVYSWGDTGLMGRPGPREYAQPIPGLSGVTSLAVAEHHALAVLADGSVRAWGGGAFGELGSGGYGRWDTPTVIAGLAGVRSVGASHNASFVVLADGSVRSTGYQCGGERGDGTETRRPFPQPAANGLTDVISLAAGDSHTLAVRRGGAEDGTVWGWGYDFNAGPALGSGFGWKPLPQRLNTLTGIRRVAAGRETSYALHANGTLHAWGSGGNGALGNGSSVPSASPVVVGATLEGGRLADVVDFDAGHYGGIALTRTGDVFTWGNNYGGQLGNGTIDLSGDPPNHPVPAKVSGLQGIVDVDAGYEYNLALRADGAVFAWGSNGGGQLGDGTTLTRSTPARIGDLPRVVALAAGGRSLALAEDGTVWAWGGCGIGCATPQQVAGLDGIVAIDVSWSGMRYALRRDGVLLSWGPSTWGEAGTGSFGAVNEPTPVLGLTGVTAMRGGGQHAVALGDPTLSGIVDEASGAGSATTDGEADGAAPGDAIETSVTTSGGAITIREEPAADVLPAGYSVPGGQVVITAPPQTAADPIRIVFRLDASQVPTRLTVATIAVFRNGAQAGDCPGSSIAIPYDPCVALRETLADGDVRLTVLTSQASTWTLGWPAPVADAGGPYRTTPGSPVQLDATGSSGDGALTYEWSPATGLDDPSSPTPTFTSVETGDYAVTLRVTDANGQSAAALTVVSVHEPPPANVCAGPAPPGAIVRGSGNDTINGTAGNDVIFDSGGANTIDGKGGNDVICTGSGNDKIEAGAGDDVVFDTGGANTVNGAGGNDQITTGPGSDKVDGGGGDDYLQDEGGANTVNGGSGIDVILTGVGNDKIDAGDGADTVIDAGGANTVNGGGGTDLITTGAGADTIDGGTDRDTIDAGAGANVVNGSSGGDTVRAGAGPDRIDGGGEDDVIDAGDGNNDVKGSGGNDRITTGAGDDKVDGGAGFDTCSPGAGNNTVRNCEA